MKIIASMRDSDGSHANQALRRLAGAFATPVGEVLRSRPVPLDTDLFIQWGFKPTVALKSAMDLDIPYVIVDLGYFDHDRMQTFSISINGFHGLSMQREWSSTPPVRPSLPIRDWREGGDEVIILGQMPEDQSLRGQDIEAWMGRAATAAIDVWGKKVVKRPHPKMLNPWEPKLPALESLYDSTYAFVSWTSTAAIQTIAAGVPTICAHPASMGFPVGTTETRVRMPGRVRWMQDISNRQYDFNSKGDLKSCANYIVDSYEQAVEAPKEKL